MNYVCVDVHMGTLLLSCYNFLTLLTFSSVSHISLAGKTTLISILTWLYEPTSGQAMLAAYDPFSLLDSKEKLADQNMNRSVA